MDKYYVMDPESPKTFLKGVFITCNFDLFPSEAALGSLSGAIHAARTRRSTFVLASQAGINGGLVGLSFFGLREYVISPVLTSSLPIYTQRREAIQAFRSKRPYDEGPISLMALRSNNVLDTALSGAITGASLNVSRRGMPGLVPGFFTMGLACTLVQVVWNELQVTRIKIVSRAQGIESPFGQTSSRGERSASEKLLDRLGWIFPIKRISDEEYLRKLKAQRERVLKRIQELEDEARSDSSNTDNK